MTKTIHYFCYTNKVNRSYESEREQGKGRYMGVFEGMGKRGK